MKPKKRQPLDFTGIPVEPPVEDVGRSPETDAEFDEDAPVTEPDLDLDIAAVPEASVPPILDRGPLDLGPEHTPEPTPPVAETPRVSARRGFFGGASKHQPAPKALDPIEAPKIEAVSREPEAVIESAPPPRSSFKAPQPELDPAPFSPARGRRSPPVEAEPLAPLPSFLTAPAASQAAQPPAPVVEPEPPAPSKRFEAAVSKPRETSTISPPVTSLSTAREGKKPMPAPLFWSLAIAAASL